ncbi:MAG: nuclear transport factor 2 family protein [Lewinellaceae bacterium]|nr:nuclear transport factor 2 family protein [Lewinellaceae bacterium]
MLTRLLLAPICLCLCFSAHSQTLRGNARDLKQIQAAIVDFSQQIMAGNAAAIGAAYTPDARLFPPARDIIIGREAILQYWTPSGASRTSYHRIMPTEIVVTGKTAYDHGYYEGKTRGSDGQETAWRGKYVIVWKKSKGKWLIYLDSWNRVP